MVTDFIHSDKHASLESKSSGRLPSLDRKSALRRRVVSVVTVSALWAASVPAVAVLPSRVHAANITESRVAQAACTASVIVGRTNAAGKPRQAARASGRLFDCLAEQIEAGRGNAIDALLSEVIELSPKWGEPYEQRYLHRAAGARSSLAEAMPADAGKSCVKPATHDTIRKTLEGAQSDLAKFRELSGDAGSSQSLLASEQTQIEAELTALAEKRCQCGDRDAKLEACADSPEVKAALAEQKKAEEKQKAEAESAAAASVGAEAEAADAGPNVFQKIHARMPSDQKTRALYYAGAGAGFVGIVLGVVSVPFLVRGSKLGKEHLDLNVEDDDLRDQGTRADAMALGFGVSGAAFVLGGAAMILTPMLLKRRSKASVATTARSFVAHPVRMGGKTMGLGLSGRF